MSDQPHHPQATANASAEPRLCKMACGFFGSGATGDCCSKCFRELQKKAETQAVAAVKQCAVAEPTSTEPTAMEMDTSTDPPQPEPVRVQEPMIGTETPDATTAGKRKKKKASYKAMMAGMMHGTSTRDVEKEKEQLRKVTGGGAFSKIDKI